jgi:oleate hydratase
VVAHIVGAGLASLSAAVYLIKDADFQGQDIFIYEAKSQLGGAMAWSGRPASGYVVPTARILEQNYRCAFELFSLFPSATDGSRSIKEEIEEFHRTNGWDAKGRLVDRQGRILQSPHFGLSVADRADLAKLVFTPEDSLDGKRIDEFFSPKFFKTEFWILWTTMMNALPQHSAIEFRRFMLRFLEVLPSLSDMKEIYRTRFNQQEAIIEPIVGWLRARGVHFVTGALVNDVELQERGGETVAISLSYAREGRSCEIRLGEGDLLLISAGSQVADLSVGSMTEPPRLNLTGHSWALWDRLARRCGEFGNPGVFFGEERLADTKWITFAVTTTDPTFFTRMEALTGSETGKGGLTTFTDSRWLITISIFHQPEFHDQPADVKVWWGFGMYPDRLGDFVNKPMSQCSGAEVLKETLRHAGLDSEIDKVVQSSTCIPCLLPYAGSVWQARRGSDRPSVVPRGAKNFGFIGQFSEVADDACFTMEYAVRTAREAVVRLCGLENTLPPVYRGHHDPKALLVAARTLLA